MADEVTIELEISDDLTWVTSAADILRNCTVKFNGRSFTVLDFLSACMPLLDDIEENLDYIRAEELLTGKPWLSTDESRP